MKLGANFALNIGWKSNNVPKLDVFVQKIIKEKNLDG